MLAGRTDGNWNGTNDGYFDAAAVKLDADGKVLWRWQVTTCLIQYADTLSFSDKIDACPLAVVIWGTDGGDWLSTVLQLWS